MIKFIAIDEMRHAEMSAERIKELGGEPLVGYDGTVQKGQAVERIFPYGSDQRFIENPATAILPRHSWRDNSDFRLRLLAARRIQEFYHRPFECR